MVWLIGAPSPSSNSSDDEDNKSTCLLNENHPFYGALTGDVTIDARKPKGWGTRHTLAVLGCVGFFVSFSLRVNMSMAIVAMVNHTALQHHQQDRHGSRHTDPLPLSRHFTPAASVSGWLVEHMSASRGNSSNGKWQDAGRWSDGNITDTMCIGYDNMSALISQSIVEDGPFVWSELTQGVILSAYFMGYTVSQIPGGRVAERFGGARTFGIGILMSSLLTLLTPMCAYHSITSLVSIRILQGLASGVTCPAMHFMLARWVPPPERSRITTSVYIGKQLGMAITILLSGPLAGWKRAGGWAAIFYVTGAGGLLWYLCWFVYIYDTPASNPRIKAKERLYIDAYFKPHGISATPASFPWRRALLSAPVLALVLTHFCQNWGDYLIVTELPTYFSTMLHYPLNQNAIFSALPQLFKVIVAVLVSLLSDSLVNRGVGLTASRKLWNSVGMFIPAVLMLAVSYTGCNEIAVITLITSTVAFNGAIFSGYNINHMDLAPNFAGTLMGLTNCVATLAGVLAPFVTGFVINLHPTLANWRIVFITSAGIFLFGNTVFCLLGTSQEQEWNESPNLYEANLGMEYKRHSHNSYKNLYQAFQMRRSMRRFTTGSI